MDFYEVAYRISQAKKMLETYIFAKFVVFCNYGRLFTLFRHTKIVVVDFSKRNRAKQIETVNTKVYP